MHAFALPSYQTCVVLRKLVVSVVLCHFCALRVGLSRTDLVALVGVVRVGDAYRAIEGDEFVKQRGLRIHGVMERPAGRAGTPLLGSGRLVRFARHATRLWRMDLHLLRTDAAPSSSVVDRPTIRSHGRIVALYNNRPVSAIRWWEQPTPGLFCRLPIHAARLRATQEGGGTWPSTLAQFGSGLTPFETDSRRNAMDDVLTKL